MKYTGNYNLKKPEGTDIVNIADLNDNMDVLDAEVKMLADAMEGGNASVEVNQINTKIGTNTDIAGTTTVFARLKQIYDHLGSVLSSTRAAKIDNLDMTVSSRATQASVDAKASQTSVNTLTTNVGSNTDASSPTGSVHAKLKDIKSSLSSSAHTWYSASDTVQHTIIGSTPYNVLYVSGSNNTIFIYAFCMPESGSVRVKFELNSSYSYEFIGCAWNKTVFNASAPGNAPANYNSFGIPTLSSPMGTQMNKDFILHPLFYKSVPVYITSVTTGGTWNSGYFDTFLEKGSFLIICGKQMQQAGQVLQLRNLTICYTKFQ